MSADDHDQPEQTPGDEPAGVAPPRPGDQVPGWPPAATDSPRPPAPGRRVMVAILVAVVMLVVGGMAAAVVMMISGSGHPDAWDPRVLDLVRFVEDERDLRFDHPVEVEFLTAEEYSRETTTEEAEITEEEREEIERFEGAFRALGLIQGDVDLIEESNELSDEGTLAFYEFDAERIVVRGTELTVDLRVTLVHELTHALQDQHFDIGRIDDLETDGEMAALQALIEGDATRVENAYIDELEEAELEEYEEASGPDAAPELDVPEVLLAYFSAPYVLGEQMVEVLTAAQGGDAVDEAFADPPTTEEHLFDPFTYLDDDESLTVESLAPPDGAEVLDDGDFGALTWFLLLAERIQPHAALRAVDGWGGDAYVLYESDGRPCIAVRFVGDTEGDTAEMAEALDVWTERMPEGAAKVSREGEAVDLRSCDPGADADLQVTGASSEAMVLPATRAAAAGDALRNGATEDQAECFGQAVVTAFSLEELTDPEGTVVASPSGQQRLDAAVAACR